MQKFSASNHKNTKIFANSFYSFFGILIPYGIVFLLVGEINLLGLNWNAESNISWQLYTIIFSMSLLAVVWQIIGWLTNTLSLNDFPFLFSSVILAITVFLSSLIPLSTNEITNTIIIIGRVLIVGSSSIITFFITNKVIKFIIFNTNQVDKVVDRFSTIVKKDEKSNEQFKSYLDAWKKTDQKEADPIEVEVEVKKEK